MQNFYQHNVGKTISGLNRLPFFDYWVLSYFSLNLRILCDLEKKFIQYSYCTILFKKGNVAGNTADGIPARSIGKSEKLMLTPEW